jgi:phage gp45-like
MSFVDAIRGEIEKAANRLAASIVRRGLIGTSPSSTYFFQVEGDDEETFESVELQQHYGFTSRPPAGGECIVVCPGGEGVGGVSISEQDRAHRPALSAEGDVAVYGKKGTGQPLVTLAASGQVTITSGGATPGTVVLKADGSIQVTAGAGKTVDVAGATAFQLLGDNVISTMQTFFTSIAALTFFAGAVTTLAPAAAAAQATMAGWASTKAKVG